MDKQQLLKRIETAWAALQDAYAGLQDAQLEQPGVIGDWSVKDILAHVTTWEEEALKNLPHILEGDRLPRYSTLYGGVDAFNARMWEQKRHLPLHDVLAGLDAVHGRLVDYIQAAPEEQFTTETRFRRRIRLDTYGHYPDHSRAIEAWRRRPVA